MKKIIIISLLALCLLFAVSGACASDVNDTAIAGDDTNDGAQIISSAQEEFIQGTDNGTFTALQEKIWDAEEGSTVILENDYSYDEGFTTTGITVSKSLTIDGGGHIIDAKSEARIFYLSGAVTLKNITFKNGFYKVGGSVYTNHENSVIDSCVFINSVSKLSDSGDGGAIYNSGRNLTVVFCDFKECSSNDRGGAIYNHINTGSVYITSCNFTKCTTKNYGGACYDCTSLNDSTFKNCKAIEPLGSGGAVSGGSVNNSRFIKCSAYEGGGIGTTGGVYNSVFIDCSAGDKGGAVRGNGNNKKKVYNCTFTNCTAEIGGAVFYHPDVENCTFRYCSADNGGGTYDCQFVHDCLFIYCSAKENGGAIHTSLIEKCSFVNCTPQNVYNRIANLTITVSNIDEGEIAVVNISIDKEATGNITVLLDNNPIDAKFTQGSATIPLADLTTGDHKIKVQFAGDENYTKATKEATFKVRANPGLNVKITAIDSSHAQLNITFAYTLNVSVYVFVADASRVNATTSSGKRIVDLDNLKSGEIITVKFAGTTKYMASSQSVIFEGGDDKPVPVVYPVKIIASDLNMIYSSSSPFKVTVYGSDGKLASGASVAIKIGDKTVATVKTCADGVATYNPTQTQGTYKISAVALGMTITKTLTVKHVVTLKNAVVKKSAKKLVIQAALAKVNGKVLKNKKVTFKFNGKQYTAKTNKKGVAKVTIGKSVLKKLKVGKKVTYQATYLKDTVKKSVKVKK